MPGCLWSCVKTETGRGRSLLCLHNTKSTDVATQGKKHLNILIGAEKCVSVCKRDGCSSLPLKSTGTSYVPVVQLH